MAMSEKDARDFYGKDAVEWLRRWDAGETVWTIEMGGMGPGYEQCIQITVAEILRHMLDAKYKASDWMLDGEKWERDRDKIEEYGFANKVIKQLGLSGAQWGAAVGLAAQFYRRGPADVMRDERVKQDRHIQTRRAMPQAA